MTYSFAIIALLIGVFVYLLYRQRKKQANDTRSHHIVLLDGFPVVHIPISLPRDDAEAIAGNLQAAYNAAWKEMGVIYGVEPRPAPIAVIGTSLFAVDPEHPHVLWPAPRDKMFLKVQVGMYYWFVRELHNIFRYQLYGMQHIYRSINETDAALIKDVELWIDRTYRRNDES